MELRKFSACVFLDGLDVFYTMKEEGEPVMLTSRRTAGRGPGSRLVQKGKTE